MFEKHIDREEDRGLILYLDNKLEATEIHMKTNFQENLYRTVNVFTLTLFKTFFPLCTRFVLLFHFTSLSWLLS
jgi:hypothetical protein